MYRAKRLAVWRASWNSNSDNYHPNLRVDKKRTKLFDSRSEKVMRWARSEMRTKHYYEDCSYHPCLITAAVNEGYDYGMEGRSLVDGTGTRSCSLRHCGVVFFTQEEAFARATYIVEHGWESYHENYNQIV